jgi:hypothetical protein
VRRCSDVVVRGDGSGRAGGAIFGTGGSGSGISYEVAVAVATEVVADSISAAEVAEVADLDTEQVPHSRTVSGL